jgi:hypothetical protein
MSSMCSKGWGLRSYNSSIAPLSQNGKHFQPKQQTTNNKQQTTNNKQQTTNNKPQTKL